MWKLCLDLSCAFKSGTFVWNLGGPELLRVEPGYWNLGEPELLRVEPLCGTLGNLNI